MGMLEKNLYDEVVIINSPIRRKKWSRGPASPGHDLVSRLSHTGMWNTGVYCWTKTKTKYVKIKCAS